MELKPELAQSIVDHMMTQIPYNINIMNKKGYIIASGNKSRINTLHVGAVDAIKQRKTLPMEQQYGNHGQPGVNMPLKFKNEIIGVVRSEERRVGKEWRRGGGREGRRIEEDVKER